MVVNRVGGDSASLSRKVRDGDLWPLARKRVSLAKYNSVCGKNQVEILTRSLSKLI